jgi:hypothetical protein
MNKKLILVLIVSQISFIVLLVAFFKKSSKSSKIKLINFGYFGFIVLFSLCLFFYYDIIHQYVSYKKINATQFIILNLNTVVLISCLLNLQRISGNLRKQ